MIVGIPRERAADENRAGLPPRGAAGLVRQGHEVIVERGAGLGSGFPDEEYVAAGARIVHSREEVYGRAALVAKVQAPVAEEWGDLA